MDIQNAIQFADFLAGTGLVNSAPIFVHLVNCVTNLRTNCNCHKREDKLRMHAQCNSLYSESMGQVSSLKDLFLDRTPDRQIIFRNEHAELLRLGIK